MKKVTTVELMKDGVSLGHAPLIQEKGKKAVMLHDGNEPLTFETAKLAKEEGKKYIEKFG